MKLQVGIVTPVFAPEPDWTITVESQSRGQSCSASQVSLTLLCDWIVIVQAGDEQRTLFSTSLFVLTHFLSTNTSPKMYRLELLMQFYFTALQ